MRKKTLTVVLQSSLFTSRKQNLLQSLRCGGLVEQALQQSVQEIEAGNMKASVFRNFNVVVEDKSLLAISKEIIEGKYKSEVEEVRQLFASGNKAGADELKKKLPGFTPSATFSGGRKGEHLTFYSQCIVLDLDNLTPEQLEDAFKNASSIPYTFCCFRSPKGNGLKIIAEVTSMLQHHENAYTQLADYYQSQLEIPIDRSGKDVTRLCFYSYDPLAHKNISNKKFSVQISETEILPEAVKPMPPQSQYTLPATHDFAFAESYRSAIKFTENVAAFSEGNRNNLVYRLACNCNRTGIPYDDALFLILSDYNFNLKEVTAAVNSAYKHHDTEFAKFAHSARFPSPAPVPLSAGEKVVEDRMRPKKNNLPTNLANCFHQHPIYPMK